MFLKMILFEIDYSIKKHLIPKEYKNIINYSKLQKKLVMHSYQSSNSSLDLFKIK